ncbi:MAG: hypothetical protein K9N01_03820 [Cephaloticoccus sp.]|nr:hypothetical protein [Cephaloticoccus sp.]
MNAADFGFSATASGLDNTRALQRAVDRGGTIAVTVPGCYRIAGTVYLGSHTALKFGHGVTLQKVDEAGPFTHVLLNKGALTKTYDEHILVEGLSLQVNGIDFCDWTIYGLRGQIAFFYVHDLTIRGFRCLDLGKSQFAIHVCTFEDLIVEDVIVHGDKDGIHLGRGKRYRISNGVFKTFDDAIALNGHDYASGNPELGWIEDGLVENCHDLNADKVLGFFCRILAGAWIDWIPGMIVQNSDTVVSHGRLYRVRGKPDGQTFASHTPPSHNTGTRIFDGIHWVMVQDDVNYDAGVRRVVFRDIILSKPRIGFSVHFDEDRFSRSFYPGSKAPMQRQLYFDHITVAYPEHQELISICTPVDGLTITNTTFRDSPISFYDRAATIDQGTTRVSLIGCTFTAEGPFELLANSAPHKTVILKTIGSIVLEESFSASASATSGTNIIKSDLPGLSDGS